MSASGDNVGVLMGHILDEIKKIKTIHVAKINKYHNKLLYIAFHYIIYCIVSEYALDRVRVDQVTTEQLNRSRAVVARVCELDTRTIDATRLAERLQGLSRAISDIVLARGEIEVTHFKGLPEYVPGVTPEIFVSNVLRRHASPETRTGRGFTAVPGEGLAGASMSVKEVFVDDALHIYEASIPPDRVIDAFLMGEPDPDLAYLCVAAQDWRIAGKNPVSATPFYRPHDYSAPGQYLSIVQELSLELLAVSA